MNIVALAGRLAADPEVKQAGEYKYTRLVVAVRRPGAKESVDYAEVRVWGPTGENCAKYLKKGGWIALSGAFRRDIFDRADGSKGSAVYVLAQNVDFGAKPGGGGAPAEASADATPAAPRAQRPAQTPPAKAKPAPTPGPPDVPDPFADDADLPVDDEVWAAANLPVE